MIRTQLFNPEDLENVKNIQDGYRFEPLSAFLGTEPLASLPALEFPEWNEGDLTRSRAALVNQGFLADRARALGLDRHVMLGRTERRTSGEQKDSVLANCLEAVIGAMYLDSGLAAVIAWAEGVFGYETTFYTPVLLLDGIYTGRNPVLRLGDWNAPAGSSPWPGHSLLRTPSEDLGGDRGTLVVGAASAATGRLLSFDLKVHPEITGKVADEAREEILATGDDSDLESMVADVRAHIIIAGVGFRPAALIPYLADAAETSIREHHGDGDLHSLSGLVRAHIIIAGDKWLFPRRNREGLRILDAAGGEGSWTHVVTLSPLSGRELPELDPAAENPRILLSGDGREAIVAWQRDGRWRYVESRGDGWTPTLSVHPHLGDDPEAIDRLFERRIRSR